MRMLEMSDWQAVAKAFGDWPLDRLGPCTPDRMVGTIRQWQQQSQAFAYEHAGEPVGFVVCTRDFAEVTHAAVVPEHRNQGHYGRMMLEFAESMSLLGVESMEARLLDQSSFLASRHEVVGTEDGETGRVTRVVGRKSDFEG